MSKRKPTLLPADTMRQLKAPRVMTAWRISMDEYGQWVCPHCKTPVIDRNLTWARDDEGESFITSWYCAPCRTGGVG